MKFTIALIAAVSTFVEASQFKSGAVTGFEKFTYGKFITRMKAPNKKGTVASFFTYWNGPNFFPGGWNELDVEIVPSVSQNPFSMNIIYGDGKTKRETHDYKASFDPKDDWHIYEMAWTPEFIAWSIDNKEVRRVNKDDPSVKLTSKPQSVMMNFWTPTFESWGKGLDAKDMPWTVEYDYVETYTYNSHTKGFDFHWRDSFNTFDTNRWHKSDNTTFDANSTTFRASQAFIKDGSLVLKMEPDVMDEVHGIHRFEPAEVEPVMTEPTPTHGVAKGTKAKKADEHYDVGAEQHYSHMRREGHGGYAGEGHEGYGVGHEGFGEGQEGFGQGHEGYPGMPYAPPMYGYGPGPYPGYGQEFGGDMYGRHADPYAAQFYQMPTHMPAHMPAHEYPAHEKHAAEKHDADKHAHETKMPADPYHYNPYHHQQPPTSKADAEQHMGAEAAFFYKEMHNLPKQAGAPKAAKGAKANFAVGDHLGDEMTPFEHSHQESHHAAHDSHYADSEHYSHDQPHHGDYTVAHESTHYSAPHHGEEWNTGYHSAHGVEDGHRFVTEHHPVAGEYDLHEHHGEPHNEHGQDYTHDTDEHDGHALMGQIEHEFDELFHEMEHNTKHGVEHHDVSYLERTLTDHQRDPQHHVSDFQGIADHEGHREAHHDAGYEGHWTGEAHHGDYSTAHHGDYATAHHGDHESARHGDWNVEGYHGEHASAHHGDQNVEGHHGDYSTAHHGDYTTAHHGDYTTAHHGDYTTAHHGDYATAHHGDWNVESHHGDHADAHHGDWNVEGHHGEHAPAHHGDWNVESHDAWNVEGHHGDHESARHGDWNVEGHHGEHADAHHGDWNVEGHHGDHADAHHGDWNVESHHGDHEAAHGDDHRTDFGHGDAAHEHHNEHGQDYTHDTDFHDGHALMGQIEHEYDELFHEMEHRTKHGVEHHDISFVERTITDHEKDPQHHVSDFQAVPDHEGHREAHHDAGYEGHWTGEAHHGDWNVEGEHGDYATAHHGDYSQAHHGESHHSEYDVSLDHDRREYSHGEYRHAADWNHEVPAEHIAPVHHEALKHHEEPMHLEEAALTHEKKSTKPAAEKKQPSKETKEVAKKLYYQDVPTGHDFVHRMLSQ